MNVIMRPVYNRPEMLALSIESEVVARSTYTPLTDYHTVFVAECNTVKDVFNVIDYYPFSYEVVVRSVPHGLTANILEGYKYSFNLSDDYVITIEDDIVLHNTFFKYIDSVLSLGDSLPKFSVINAFGANKGEVNYIKKAHHYVPWSPLVDKYFFEKYVLPHANSEYYNNRPAKMVQLNKNYIQYYKSHQYKFNNLKFNEQAGLINRLVDHVMIDEGIYVLTPEVNRVRNIGYFGKNRQGGSIPGDNFSDRVENLKKIVSDPKLMLKHAGNNKHAQDYVLFKDVLDGWVGDIKVRGE